MAKEVLSTIQKESIDCYCPADGACDTRGIGAGGSFYHS